MDASNKRGEEVCGVQSLPCFQALLIKEESDHAQGVRCKRHVVDLIVREILRALHHLRTVLLRQIEKLRRFNTL